MYTKMRRSRQELSRKETRALMRRNTAGVLALSGCADTGGFAYGVPLSYVYLDEEAWEQTLAADGLAPWAPACDEPVVGRIMFHSARSGTKLEALAADGRAMFTVIDEDRIVPEEYTTYFRSVIVFGRASVIDDDEGRRKAAELLAQKYCPGETAEGVAAEIDRFWRTLCLVELVPEHISGKEAIELTRQRD